MSWKEDANGYTWELRGNEITCNESAVCKLEFVLDLTGAYWKIAGDDAYRFSTATNAFYFVMDRCI